MGLYRKKPVEVRAYEVNEQDLQSIAEWCGGISVVDCILIETLEGTMRADLGDYVIRGVQGEFYPCKADIFHATYDPVDETEYPRDI